MIIQYQCNAEYRARAKGQWRSDRVSIYPQAEIVLLAWDWAQNGVLGMIPMVFSFD